MTDKKTIATTLGIFLGGLTAGSVVGYFSAKKKYEALANEEIDSVKERYALLNKDRYPTPADVQTEALITTGEKIEVASNGEQMIKDILKAKEVYKSEFLNNETFADQHSSFVADEDEVAAFDAEIKELAYAKPEEEEIPASEFASSIFGADPGTSAEEVTMPEVDMDHPYVISIDEYFDDDPAYAKISIAYWEEDETLADERETIIPDQSIVGVENLHQFGLGSQDRNIVYVRNHKMETDFEIVRDQRAFSYVVHGVPRERIKKNPVRRMREGDE